MMTTDNAVVEYCSNSVTGRGFRLSYSSDQTDWMWPTIPPDGGFGSGVVTMSSLGVQCSMDPSRFDYCGTNIKN